MASLKQTAQDYQPKQTKNISELQQVSTDFNVNDGEGVDNDGKPFKYKFIEVNGEAYRVPGAVLGQIKDLLAENPNLKSFKVKRTGEGLKTRYTVIPLN